MPSLRCKIRKHRRNERRSSSYESVMRTLLLQNQQIIIQQQNMMFMLIKQHYPAAASAAAAAGETTAATITTMMPTQQHPQHQQQQQQTLEGFNPSQQPHQTHAQPQTHLQPPQQQQQQSQQQPQPQSQQPQQQQQSQQQQQPSQHQHQTQHQSHQQTHNHQMHIDEHEALSALLEGDGMMANNILYNPSTDIGSLTPYKGHIQDQDHHESPPYYSSESLTTPRVEQRPQTTVNVSQNVVKNLNDSFKSPTKPAKINVQILSGSATREMKNSKAKIIQSMNISEFLRQVHHDESVRSSQ